MRQLRPQNHTLTVFIICGNFDHNSRSRRVIEKLGFRYFSTTPSETRYDTVENSMNYIRYKENHT